MQGMLLASPAHLSLNCSGQLALDVYWLETDSARFTWMVASLHTGLEQTTALRTKIAAHTGLKASIHLLDTSNPQDRASSVRFQHKKQHARRYQHLYFQSLLGL